MSTNKTWHDRHPMPKQATLEQQIRWHRQHAKRCACRPIPEQIRVEMERRGKG